MAYFRKRITVAGAVILAALAAVIFLPLGGQHLVLDSSGTQLLRHRVNEGDTFALQYTHSVNLSPVREIFEVRGGEIYFIALEFETFGAGMPTELEPGQTLTRLPQGGMRIEGAPRHIGDLRYIIGHYSQLTLCLGALQIPLKGQAGQSVRFSVRRLNFIQLISTRGGSTNVGQ